MKVDVLELSQEQSLAYTKLREKRKHLLKRSTSLDIKRYISVPFHSRCTHPSRKNMRFVRLRLDEALDQLENSDSKTMYEGWSQARIRSYQQIESKPNAYYYRFNAPGERQQNGLWTARERELFFNRLAEVGADGQWGIFAIAIPGRVGYQVGGFFPGTSGS